MKKRNFFKKTMALVLVFAMLSPTISHLETCVKEVHASDDISNTISEIATEVTDESIGYVIVGKNDVTITETSDSKAPKVMTIASTYADYATCKDYVFAGWYTDANATEAVASGSTGDYARFVPAEVLSVKCQVTNGIVQDTSIDKYKGKYVLRFVSSIDSMDYTNVGFVISYEDPTTKQIVEKTNKTKTVFKRIDSTTGYTSKGSDLYEFSPKVIDGKSERFITAKWPVATNETDIPITVKAFWTTKDGTRVYGASRCVSVEDGFSNAKTTSVSFKSTQEYQAKTTISDVTYNSSRSGNTSNKPTTAYVLGCTPNSDNTYTVHTRVAVVPNSLPSVTKFNFGNAGSAIHRNLYTSYEVTTTTTAEDGTETTTKRGVADRTWYDVDTNKDEFVIASSADLYGLADVVNTSHVTFENKTVYVVADIKANKGNATENGWSTTGVTNGTSYYWNPIGYRSSATADKNTFYPFLGTFDGQMHTISGINYDSAKVTTDVRYGGLFGPTYSTQSTTATIQNFKLTNSYFYSANVGVGSVSGYGKGNFHTIFSDAYVISSANGYVGGLLGMSASSTIDECWFDGIVKNTSTTAQYTGGFIGQLYTGTVAMNSCLNTGIVNVEAYANTAKKTFVGGLVGAYITNTSRLDVSDCLVAGDILVNETYAGYYGLITGYLGAKANTITNNYAITPVRWTDTIKSNVYNSATPTEVTEAQIIGDEAEITLTDFDFDNTWTVVTNGTPILSSFEEEIANPDTSWYDDAVVDENGNAPGTAHNPYILYDMNDLYGFSYLSQTNNFDGKIIRLGADIVVNKGNASDWSECAPKYEWTPIGKSTAFAGIFDGSDPETGDIHSISGIYNVETSSKWSGLFAQTASATISNFNLKNSYFESNQQQLGSIVGYLNGGSIHSIKSNAIVVGSNNMEGGMVGLTNGTASITNCWFDGNVTNTGQDKNSVGGILGSTLSNISMTNCLNTGDIDVSTNTQSQILTVDSASYYNPYVGGLLGYGNKVVTITNCLNAGEIFVNTSSEAKTLYGGIVGFIPKNQTVKIVGSYNDSTKCLYAYGYRLGTVMVDGNTPTNAAPVNEALATGLVYGEEQSINRVSYSEGVIGENAKTTFAKLDFKNYWTVTDSTPILTSFAEKTIVPDTTWYDTDKEAGEYVLYNAADLYGLSKLSQSYNFSGKIIRLGADIVINEGKASDWSESAPKYEWTPIGKSTAFAGIFDGSDPKTGKIHTISGIYNVETSSKWSGLFGQVTSTISNLNLTNSYFESNQQQLGSIAGCVNSGGLHSIKSDAIVVGSSGFEGGLVGFTQGTIQISNCWFTGTVKNTGMLDSIGGILGIAYSGSVSMSNCLNTGEIDVSSNMVTKPVGTTTYYHPIVGGLMGQVRTNVTITNCLNAGEILVNSSNETDTLYGGIVGQINSGKTVTITGAYNDTTKCEYAYGYNLGTVTANGTKVTSDSEDSSKNINQSLAGVSVSDKVTGKDAKTGYAKLDFNNFWTLTDSTPILTSFTDNIIAADMTWYRVNPNAEEYILYNAADLYGFAMLSKDNQFSGITIKLGQDIVVNEGDANEWAKGNETDKLCQWLPIGSTGKTFAGTFDGCSKTISGVYLNTTSGNSGLFAVTRHDSIVKNLRLENSYFKATNIGLGSVAGQGRGKFQNIYSNAIVTSSNLEVGGIVGMGYSTSLDIRNCWFNGSVTNTGNSAKTGRGTGGILGGFYTDSSEKKAVIVNCLNEGIVNTAAYKYEEASESDANSKIVRPLAGGIVGDVSAMATVDIITCLNVGKITVNGATTDGYGPIVGYNTGTAYVAGCYATEESCADISLSNLGENSITKVEQANIMDTLAETTIPQFDWVNSWETREGDFPAVRFPNSISTTVSALQKQIRGNSLLNAIGMTESRAILNKASTVAYDLPQGGCVVGDYYYQALRTNNESGTTTARILKYNLIDGSKVLSNELTLYHANDITYNSRTGKLVVCHSVGDPTRLSVIDIESIETISDEDVERIDLGTNFNIYSIDYNAVTDRYVVGRSGGTTFAVLNSDFEILYEFASVEEFRTSTTQGISSDEKYIYCVLDNKDVIVVYDWFGNYISHIQLSYEDDGDYEPESIGVVDDTIYVVVWNTVNKTDTYLYTIPATDLTATE